MTEPRQSLLSNGLRVVTETLPGARSSALAVSVDVGARYESDSQHGISHLLEHMAFKGTERRTAQGIAEEFDNIGGDLNAFTSHEHTVYHARVMPKDMPVAVDVFSDILLNSTFDDEELAREQHVVRQEIAMHEDTPEELVFDLFHQTFYSGQPLGRSILGTEEKVSGHRREDLHAFVAQHYGIERMVLSASGVLDHEALVERLEKAFGLFGHVELSEPEPGRYTGGEHRRVDDLEQAHIVLGLPGVPYHDSDYYASQVLSTILGGGLSSRLFQEVREKRGLAYTVYAFQSSYVDTGMFGIYAATAERDVPELIPVVCGELLSVARKVSEAEVHRAHRQLLAGLYMSRESVSNVAESLGRQMLYYGRIRSEEEVAAGISAVTPQDVSRLAVRMLRAGPPTLVALGPAATLEPYEKLVERLAV